MGDIYRLLGSGVQTIILIDGLFHGKAAVWQREILLALENGIEVVGATSMGALRAAELHPYGMVGHGIIFEWYRDGYIDGDDEVALIHADDSNDYLPLSEPLVNIRYNLRRAVAQKLLTATQANRLVSAAKSLSFTKRSFSRLLTNPNVQEAISCQSRTALKTFWDREKIDLKRQDTVETLTTWAKPKANPTTKPILQMGKNRDSYYQHVITASRGFLASNQQLVSGQAILAAWQAENKQSSEMETRLVKQFFLGLFAQQLGRTIPESPSPSPQTAWLAANGLTQVEFERLWQKRAPLNWLCEQSPATLGFNFDAWERFTAVLPTLPPWHQISSLSTLKQEVYEIFYLAQWAKVNGVRCPKPFAEHFRQQWEAACQLADRPVWLAHTGLTADVYQTILNDWAVVSWILQKKPPYFGYTSWTLTAVLLEELQMTGEAARLSAQ